MGLLTTQGYRGKLVDKLTGTILDQFADEDIKVSNNILDLFDLGEIPGTYTQTLTLPGTKLNNAFFEQYFDISVWEPDIFNTNQKVEAYLDFDSFYLVNGYLQLNKVNVLQNKFVDSYEVTLFGIISNFSIDTRASFLTDITALSVYNHTSSYANISMSWDRQLFNGDVVYPMVEYGNNNGTLPTIYYSDDLYAGIDGQEGALTVQDYKPAIRIKKVWDSIFQEFGYTYTGSFWNEPFLDDVYLLCDNDLRAPVYQPSIENYGQGRITVASGSTPISLTNGVTASFAFNAKDYDYDNKFTVGAATTYTTDITTQLSVNILLGFKVTNTGAGSGMPAFYLYWTNSTTGAIVGSQVLAQINVYMSTIQQSRSTTVTETFRLPTTVRSPELPPGTYQLKIEYVNYGSTNFSVQLNPDSANVSTFEIFKVNQAADGQIMDIPSNMPFGNSGVRVIDFIRSIQKKFNLVIYPDKQNPNQFVIETFNNWYKQGEIKDFNRYINLEDKISFTPANQLGYRQIKYSDAEDTDYVTTLFKRTNNRIYGESNYYDSGSYYSQGKLEVLSDTTAAGPLVRVPGSVSSGSASNTTCTTYQFYYDNIYSSATVNFVLCNGTSGSVLLNKDNRNHIACIRTGQYSVTGLGSDRVFIYNLGDCTPAPVTGFNEFPIWIPYHVSDANYRPAKVLPRLFFYNGKVSAPPYYISGYNIPSTSSVPALQYDAYPYFDVYSTGSLNGTASQFPQLDSLSLLYNNEQSVWGTTPTGSLVSDYWATYLSLLYNPRTRLVDASAVIGLADYFDLELNDIAEFRGNYYHLRAINDYNLTTGECSVQMLGPIIPDTISSILSGSWAPVVDECAFTFSASLVDNCNPWERQEQLWDVNNMIWNVNYCSGSIPPTTTSTTTSTTTVPPTTTSTTTSTTTVGPTTTTTSTTSTSTTTPPTTTTTSTTTSTTTIPPTTTTTTTSTTTSTTTTPTYFYYSIKKFDCNNSCAYVAPDLVGRSSTVLSTTSGDYYKLGSFTYQVQTEITPAPMSFDINMDGLPSNNNCSTACTL